jgi:hypothetical protein
MVYSRLVTQVSTPAKFLLSESDPENKLAQKTEEIRSIYVYRRNAHLR